MKAAAILLATSLITSTACAEAPFATREIHASCSTVRPAITALLSRRGFTPSTKSLCPDCTTFESSHLEDADGHRIRLTSTIRHRYSQPANYGGQLFGFWLARSPADTTASLQLQPAGESCRTQLRFSFHWYTAQFFLFIPVDGDPEGSTSNLLLENSYLDHVEKELHPSS